MACLLFAFSVKAQGISNDTIPKEVLMLDGKPMTEKQIQRYHKQLHKTPYGPTKGSGGLSLADRLTRRKPPLA